MKQMLLIIGCCLVKLGAFPQAQQLCISRDKTVSLVFPFPVAHVDRGTKDILVQQVKEAGNILLVKASSKDIATTNLSVVTDEGSVYSFAICYQDDPPTWIYHVPANGKASISTYANGILGNSPTAKRMHAASWDMTAAVTGIYIKDRTIYYQLRIANQGSIDYDIDFIRFYIRDKKRNKRTAMQEHELKPLYLTGNTTQVKAGGTNSVVAALEKFTLPDAKYLAIEINERNGGRHLFITVKNKRIMKAIPLPDLN